MCTAIAFSAAHHCFGRNLDLEYTYDETVTVTPRRYPFHNRYLSPHSEHFAMIGIATVIDGYPLYYDAMNEHGLCMAGLNFVGNAVYQSFEVNQTNLCTFELIPYLLGYFKTVEEIRDALKHIRILTTAFRNDLPASELHWMIADHKQSAVLECDKNGIHFYDAPIGVLTNNPPFPFQMQNLVSYRNLTAEERQNRFCKSVELPAYSRGMGALGLPGDLSSTSRFVRASFVKCNSIRPSDPISTVGQFFHILSSVEQQEGCVRVGNAHERTQYSSCCDMDTGIYYYRTYENSQICGVDLFRESLDTDALRLYSLLLKQNVHMQTQYAEKSIYFL